MPDIRPARLDDEQALARIDTLTWTSAVSPAPPPPPGSSFFGPRAPVENVLVAEEDGLVLGYVKLHQPIPLPAHAHVLEVAGLAVDPRGQRGGVGRALVQAAVEEATRRGAGKLSLRVLEPNAAARQLYEACGFVVEGVLRDEFLLEGTYVDDILMARQLPNLG